MITVVLYTNQPLLAAGLGLELSKCADLTLVAVDDLSGAVAAATEGRAEIALLDLTPDLSLSILADIRRRAPACKIVLWVQSISLELAHCVKQLGVRGILRKDLSRELTVRCLLKVSEGELWFDRDLMFALLQARPVQLSPRARQLVELVSSGMSNKQIADALLISEGTVKVYLSRLFRKLGVSHRLELALYGLKSRSAGQTFQTGPFAQAILVSENGTPRYPGRSVA